MEQTSDFDIRYHHIEFLKNIGFLLQHLYWDKDQYGKDISLEDVYKVPEVGYGFAEQISRLHGEVFLRRAQVSDNNDEVIYAEDMVGKQAIYFEGFVAARKAFYEQYLLSSPERTVIMTALPDLICKSCQINGNGNPGNHCVTYLPNRNSIDTYFEAALLERYNTISTSELAMTNYNGNRAFLTTLGTLRNKRFLSQTTTLAYKIMEESNKPVGLNWNNIKRYIGF